MLSPNLKYMHNFQKLCRLQQDQCLSMSSTKKEGPFMKTPADTSNDFERNLLIQAMTLRALQQ